MVGRIPKGNNEINKFILENYDEYSYRNLQKIIKEKFGLDISYKTINRRVLESKNELNQYKWVEIEKKRLEEKKKCLKKELRINESKLKVVKSKLILLKYSYGANEMNKLKEIEQEIDKIKQNI